jgi:hypothetical protein
MNEQRTAIGGFPRAVLNILVGMDDEPCPRLPDAQDFYDAWDRDRLPATGMEEVSRAGGDARSVLGSA